MYSASAATDATADSSAATEGKDASATAAEESPEDAVKKQLESKDVEIRDLKVRLGIIRKRLGYPHKEASLTFIVY